MPKTWMFLFVAVGLALGCQSTRSPAPPSPLRKTADGNSLSASRVQNTTRAANASITQPVAPSFWRENSPSAAQRVLNIPDKTNPPPSHADQDIQLAKHTQAEVPRQPDDGAGAPLPPPPAPPESTVPGTATQASPPAANASEQPDAPLPPLPTEKGNGVEEIPRGAAAGKAPTAPKVLLPQVINSVYRSYPLLESAIYSRDLAAGNYLAASGAFDTKIKASSENMPLGFYENYRHSVGFVQPLFPGSDLFGGYRIGRGEFQPWYLERETNKGGEFKLGMYVPFAKNRIIDERRAELSRAMLERRYAEPDIQAQLIDFVQEASYAYWEWVAAGQARKIAQGILDLALDRTDRIRKQVEAQLIDPPELTDNLRLVAERQVKLAETERKLWEKSVKLSLYLRDANGEPVVPTLEQIPDFPSIRPLDPRGLVTDIQAAYYNRPDLALYDILRQELEIDLNLAKNETLPEVDAQVYGSQDVGEPTSSKRDKSPFELEAGVYVDVPLQRRKGWGKIQAVQAKISQLRAKRELAEDKISAQVQSAYAAMVATYVQVQRASEAVRYAEELAERERLNFSEGLSDMLKVTLREQYAIEAAMKEIEARAQFHEAEADYRAALGLDRLP
ncbi:MAG: TolC family protein [Pirellulales bacterium]|nr:TolC family protein [Pirellulales bacterium]